MVESVVGEYVPRWRMLQVIAYDGTITMPATDTLPGGTSEAERQMSPADLTLAFQLFLYARNRHPLFLYKADHFDESRWGRFDALSRPVLDLARRFFRERPDLREAAKDREAQERVASIRADTYDSSCNADKEPPLEAA